MGITEPVVSPHVEAKRQRRRREILDAAIHAFREKGYHATTLEDIADRLGVRNTALYHYFPDKEAILYECHREALVEVMGLLDDAREHSDSPTEQLQHLIREHVRVMTETLAGSSLAFEVHSLEPEHEAEVIRERDRYERGLRQVIEAGIAAGEFRPVDPKVTVFAILGAINWIARWFNPGGAIRTPALGDAFAHHLVGGITCP
jgi:TetR/AcrR family transcriptional regulator